MSESDQELQARIAALAGQFTAIPECYVTPNVYGFEQQNGSTRRALQVLYRSLTYDSVTHNLRH